jgi:hypothetical protein
LTRSVTTEVLIRTPADSDSPSDVKPYVIGYGIYA